MFFYDLKGIANSVDTIMLSCNPVSINVVHAIKYRQRENILTKNRKNAFSQIKKKKKHPKFSKKRMLLKYYQN